MNINNRYTVNPLYNGSQEYDTEDEKSSSGKTTIIYQGGDGLTSALKEKLNSIEQGALVNQDAFSYIKLSDGIVSQTTDARLPKDTANITVSGKGGIKTELTTIHGIDNLLVASTSELNKGVYLFNYSKLETIVPPPEGSPSGTEPTVVITWPLTMKYVSGATLTKSDFTHILLFSKGELQWEFAQDKLTITEIEGVIDTISVSQLNFYFDQVKLINVATVADKVITTIMCLFDKVLVYKFNTILISSQTDDLWKLDKDGNLYTDRNLYSTKEVSAYGIGTGGSTGGAGALYECADVLRDGDKVQGAIAGALLSYNGSHWRAIPQSAITPDLSGYVKSTQVGAANGVAPLDNNRLIPSTYLPSYVDDVLEVDTFASLPITGQSGKIYVTLDTNLTYRWSGSNYVEISKSLALGYTSSTAFPGDEGLANTNSIAALRVLLDMFEWDKTNPNSWRIKAKKDFYSVGEVSAYGMGVGEVPTGAQYMYELKDVLFTSLSSGLLLKYNGTKWVNVNSNEVGLNELQLGIYLTTNNYAKKSDIPSLVGYATESWVTQLNFAKQSTTITAGTGLTGGGNLSANRTLALETVGTAGTYSKVTTDAYGRVTSGTYANISDIVDLTLTLASKLNVSDFLKWFTIKYNTDGTIKNIQANFDFYSIGEVSAYGVGQGETPSGALYLHELKDVTIADILNNQLLSYNSTLGKWINSNKPSYSYSEITGTPPAVDLSNYVTTNTDQNINGYKSFRDKITIYNSALATHNGFELQGTNDIAPNMTFHFPGKHANILYMDDTSKLCWNGNAVLAKSFVRDGGTADQVLRADGGVSTFSFVGQAGQPAFVWGSDGTPYNYKVWNPANFNVATSVSSTKIKPTGGGVIDANILFEENYIRFHDTITRVGSANLFPTINNANGILSFSTHPSLFGHQVGFSSDGDLYHRVLQSNSWVTSWRKILNDSNWHSIIDGRYLLLTGGSLSGRVSINSSNHDLLYLKNITDGGGSLLYFKSGETNKSEVGWTPSESWGSILFNSASSKCIGIKDDGTPHYTGSTLWHSGNDGTGSGLDADMLDGLHKSSYAQKVYGVTNLHGIPVTDSYVTFFSANNGASNQINNYMVGFQVSNNNDPSYNKILAFGIDGRLYTKKQTGGVYDEFWQSVAYITDNVASATKLQTPRSIWGQSFDGGGDISGIMSGVRSISNTTVIDYTSAQGQYFYTSGDVSNPILTLTGNVGINTTNPGYKLDVYGNFRATTTGTFGGHLTAGGFNTDGVIYSTGDASADAQYGYISVMRASSVNNATGFAWVRSGVVAFGIGHNTSNQMVLGQGLTNRTLDPWLRFDKSAIYTQSILATGYVNAQRYFTGYDSGAAQSMSCSNWFRSNGATGWINDTYGGGINMEDIYYVRVFGNKKFWVSNTESDSIRTLGGIFAEGQIKSTTGRLDLGPVSIQYDSTNRAIKFIMSDGTPCNIYATGDVAAYAMSGIGVLNLSYTFGNKLFVDSAKSTTVDAQPLISLAIGNNNTGLDWANNNAINLRANNIQIAYWDVNSFAVTKRLDVFEQATFNSNVGIGSIGMSTPLKLTVVGNIIASGTITANTSASDKRLKCNIRNFEAKDIIKSLAPKTYKWNEIARNRADVFNTDNVLYGLIYQDIKDNDYVSEYALDNMFGDEYGMIAYDRFIPIILQGEIELYDEVSLLKARIKVLEDKLKMTEQK